MLIIRLFVTFKLLVSVFSPNAAACSTQQSEGRNSELLFNRCTRQLFWQKGELLQKKKKKKERRDLNHFLLSQPITRRRAEASHMASKNREMPAEKLVIGGKLSQVSLYF